MITQKEILDIAHKEKVKTLTIDKDWVLGHFLNAMFSIDLIKDNFVFKGGICLRKCYIENYRFSEDLDFTLLDKNINIDSNLMNQIIKVATKNSGAKFSFDRKKHQSFEDEKQGYEIKVKFWGADHNPNQRPLPSARWQTTIKVDISFSEEVINPIENLSIFHNYSDKDTITNTVPSYSLIEIISEKLRSLIQRNRPRDIYDLWMLSVKINPIEYSLILNTLQIKAYNKGISIKNINDFVNDSKRLKIKRAWESSLGNHLPINQLPIFDKVYDDVSTFVETILKQ